MDPTQRQRRFTEGGCRVVIAATRRVDAGGWLATTQRLTDNAAPAFNLVGTPAQYRIMQLTADGPTEAAALDRLERQVRDAIGAAIEAAMG